MPVVDFAAAVYYWLIGPGASVSTIRMNSGQSSKSPTRIAALSLSAAVLISAGAVQARSSDRNQPIHINAAQAEADNQERVTIYRGDVVITQGTMRITGDTVWIYFDESNAITKLVSEGKPAHFRQLPDDGDEYQTADARRMEYYADEDLIVMLGNARYGEGNNRVTAERIVYDSRNGRMTADARPGRYTEEGGDGGKSRVNITITPKKQ